MGRRLLLDTTALVELDRTKQIRGVRPGDELACASISLGEIYRGVVGTPIEATREQRLVFFEQLVDSKEIEILLYTPDTARAHGFLLEYTKRTGTPRGAHDLIIAAHARETGREVFSADNRARFEDLPGVSVAQ